MSTANFSDSLKERFLVRFGERARPEEPLEGYLAYRIGGPAELLVFPLHEGDLDWIAAALRGSGVGLTVVGTGTNLLVVDEGIRGVTLSLNKAFQEIRVLQADSHRTLIHVGAGVLKPRLLEWAIENSLQGLEFSAGVPGTIGGGIYMNAGTKYGCYGDILRELTLYDFHSGAKTLKRDALHFGYRNQNAVGTSLVTSTVFELKPGNKEALRFEVDRIIAERAAKQPLDLPSCGSTFKNPEGLSAGRLIERAGLKGLRVGNAQISEKHANFIMNLGGAKAADVLSLIATIKSTVSKQFNVELECEVITLGPQAQLYL